MKLIGNVLWIALGGGLLALLWGIVGLICCCTVIGIPLGVQCFKFASLIIWPFGRDIVFTNRTGSFLANVVWILLCGWELACFACFLGLLWCITVVGIPFGTQCFKFARLALMPFGAQIV